MLREKISRLLENQGGRLRLLGMYTAVVLLIFALMVPLLGHEMKRKEADASKTLQERDAENLPNDNVVPMPDAVPANQARDRVNETGPSDDIPIQTQVAQGKGETRPAGGKAPLPVGDIKNIIWPLRGDILQEVGIVYSKTFSDYRYHNGIDIRAPRGAEVAAVLPGRILSQETSGSEAKKLLIDHGSGWQGIYSHLEEVYLKPGDPVQAGQVIGHIGQPGLNEILEGPHLHFALLREGKAVNPLDYLPGE